MTELEKKAKEFADRRWPSESSALYNIENYIGYLYGYKAALEDSIRAVDCITLEMVKYSPQSMQVEAMAVIRRLSAPKEEEGLCKK